MPPTDAPLVLLDCTQELRISGPEVATQLLQLLRGLQLEQVVEQ